MMMNGTCKESKAVCVPKIVNATPIRALFTVVVNALITNIMAHAHPISEKSSVSTTISGAFKAMSMAMITRLSVTVTFITVRHSQAPIKNPKNRPTRTTLARVFTPIIPKMSAAQQSVDSVIMLATPKAWAAKPTASRPMKLPKFNMTSYQNMESM